MNEAEKRRKQLLEQTRARYSEQRMPPAVHPRYGAVYNQLYGQDEEMKVSTLGVRTFLCVLLFTMFVAMDYKEEEVLNINSSKIIEVISTDLDVQEVWKNL